MCRDVNLESYSVGDPPVHTTAQPHSAVQNTRICICGYLRAIMQWHAWVGKLALWLVRSKKVHIV